MTAAFRILVELVPATARDIYDSLRTQAAEQFGTRSFAGRVFAGDGHKLDYGLAMIHHELSLDEVFFFETRGFE